MGSRPSLLLVLVLCLGLAVHTQNRALPKPSIRAELGRVLRGRQPVTIVCQGPAGAREFRLEEKNGRITFRDQKSTYHHGSHRAETKFRIDAVNELTAGSYFCRYHNGSSWSEHSDILELKVTDEDVSTPPSGAPRVVSSAPTTRTKPLSTAESSTSTASTAALERTGHTQTSSPDMSITSLLKEHLYILVGISVAFLLCVLLLILLLVHCQHQKKRGSPSSKDVEPRPQERLSPTADVTESTADVATTVDTLPEDNREMHSLSPAAGDPEAVTYAQLDQRALTRRAARAESPQPTGPTDDSTVYAALPRH